MQHIIVEAVKSSREIPGTDISSEDCSSVTMFWARIRLLLIPSFFFVKSSISKDLRAAAVKRR